MRILKTITTGVIALALVVTAVFGFVFTYTQNHSGMYSAVYNLTAEDEQMIIEQYGDCPNIECLLLCVRDYAVANFEYDYDKDPIFQHFDFRDTVSTGKGICFDFSCYLKACCLVWSNYINANSDSNANTPLKVFVVDIYHTNNVFAPHHSYNVVCMPDGTNYYIDLTSEVTRFAKGKELYGFEIFYTSIEAYARKYGETVINYH